MTSRALVKRMVLGMCLPAALLFAGQDAAELLARADGMVAAGDVAGALPLFREVVAARDVDVAAAARAQVRVGELLLEQSDPAAEAELQRVLEDFPDQYAQVNAARVSLAAFYVDASRGAEALPLVEAVISDGAAGKAGGDLVAGAYLHAGRLYEASALTAEAASDRDACLDNRRLAGESYRLASQAGGLTPAGLSATDRLVDLLTHRHKLLSRERNKVPAWIVEARRHLAFALAGQNVLNGEPAYCSPGDAHCVDLLNRLGQEAELYHRDVEALAWHRLALGVSVRTPVDEEQASQAVARILDRAGRGAEVVQWWHFLSDPAVGYDPTSGTIADAFGVDLERAYAPLEVNRSSMYSKLGEAFVKAGQFDYAFATHEQALLVAATPLERGAAYTGLTGTLMARSDAARKAGDRPASFELRRLAGPYARLAAAEWRNVAAVQGEHRHHGISMASETLRVAGLKEESLATATEIRDAMIASGAPPRDVAYADLYRVRAFAADQRYSEAAREAETVCAALRADPDPIVHEVRAHLLFRAIGYHMSAKEWDAAKGAYLLAKGEFGGRRAGRADYDVWLGRFREGLKLRGVEIE